MKIEQLVYLVEIAKLGSISAAAEHLHISQPAISQSVLALETELGTKLFYRSKHGTLPTEIGKIIIKKVTKVLNSLEEIKEVAYDSHQLVDNLNLATIPSLCMNILPKTLSFYTEKFPGVKIEFIESGTHEIERLVTTGKIDFGIIATSQKNHYEGDDNLFFEQLSSGQLMACVGEKSILASNKTITFEEIINFPIVTANPKYRMYHRIIHTLKRYGEPNILFKSANTEVAKSIISEGIGIGFCNSLSIKDDPYFLSQRLIPIPIEGEEMNFIFGWIRLRNTHFSIAAEEFIKNLKLTWLNESYNS